MSDPELNVKFWPPSVTAKGAKAIEAIRRPLVFAVYARSVVAVILGLAVVFGGHELLPWASRQLKFWWACLSDRYLVEARLQEDERLLQRIMGGDGAAIGSSTEISFRQVIGKVSKQRGSCVWHDSRSTPLALPKITGDKSESQSRWRAIR